MLPQGLGKGKIESRQVSQELKNKEISNVKLSKVYNDGHNDNSASLRKMGPQENEEKVH